MTDLVLEIKPEHGSHEWLMARHRDSGGRARLTASVAGAIFDEHEYLTPADLAVQMIKDKPPSEETTAAMERGQALEPGLLDYWAKKMGLPVERPEYMFVRGRILANLDGVCREKDAPVEAKTTVHRFSERQWGQEPFQYWYHQGVAQRWCFSGDPGWVHWVILDGDLRLVFYDQFVEQDELDRLVVACDEWMSYVDEGMPPLGVELTDKHVAKLNPGATGTVDLPSDAPMWVRRLADARALKKRGEEDEAEAKTWLARHLGGADVGLFDGKPIVTWKEQAGRLGFDTKAFSREYPDLYQKFERRGEPFRMMLPKGTNGDDD